jgi:hypothetical protein
MQYTWKKDTQPKEQLAEDNRVIVRIWTSESNTDHPGEDVGHISLETINPANYMSLWPKDQVHFERRGMKLPVAPEFMVDYNADLAAEARPPEVIICLYNLKPFAMHEKFHDIKSDPKFQGWALIGKNLLLNGGTAHSCASLAYDLLKAGGIYNEINSSFSSRFSSIVTPDQLVNATKAAKVYELEEHPETANFKFAGETEINPTKKSGCVIC